jgi:hypothetical protein
MKEGIRVTVVDLGTGATETIEVPLHEYLLLTTGNCHVSATQVYPKKGTHVVTIKGRAHQVRPLAEKEGGA